MWDPYAEFEKEILPNGLTVHAAHWPDRPWVAMGFVIHSGAKYDPEGLEGVAHFAEHLVSENVSTPHKSICEFFDNCGGAVSLGSTGYFSTQYRFFIPANKNILSKALGMFGEMLLTAKIEKSIESERQIVRGEFYRCFPVKYRFDLQLRGRKAMYANHWQKRFVNPLGRPESLARITKNDLQSYYDAYYAPANISVIAIGGMKFTEVFKQLSKSPFATRKEGERAQIPMPEMHADPVSENRYVFELSRHITDPVESGAYRSIVKIPGFINAAQISVVRGMLNVAINDEVREKRAWAYSVEVSDENYKDFHEIIINCDGLALRAIDEIEEVVNNCIYSLVDRDDIFKRVKRHLIARCLMADLSGNALCSNAIDDLSDYHRIISLKEVINDRKNVTMDDVKNVIRWLRPEQRWTLITQP